MNFVKAKEYIIHQLQSGLPPQYYYHSVWHTLDVLSAVETLCKEEGITREEDIQILRTAAVFHDAGFLRRYEQNEAEASRMAAELLPRYGFTPQQIESVRRCIMVTELNGIPTDQMESIMKDADFDYLGRQDYWDISAMLRKEWESIGIVKTDKEWYALQIAFLSNHEYYTATARAMREPTKQSHIVTLKKLLAKMRD